MSTVYEWNAASQQFTSHQYIATRGAKAVKLLTVHSINYVVFVNSFDSTTQTSEIKFVFLRLFLVLVFVIYENNCINNK